MQIQQNSCRHARRKHVMSCGEGETRARDRHPAQTTMAEGGARGADDGTPTHEEVAAPSTSSVAAVWRALGVESSSTEMTTKASIASNATSVSSMMCLTSPLRTTRRSSSASTTRCLEGLSRCQLTERRGQYVWGVHHGSVLAGGGNRGRSCRRKYRDTQDADVHGQLPLVLRCSPIFDALGLQGLGSLRQPRCLLTHLTGTRRLYAQQHTVTQGAGAILFVSARTRSKT